MDIKWDEEARKKYEEITENLPQFHRTIAKQLVKGKAEELAKERNAESVDLKDLVKAFFQEVPPAFKEMMKKLLSKYGIDYLKYIDE